MYIFGKAFARQGHSDKIFDIINYTFMILILLIVLYPLYFVVIASFSSPNEVAAGKVMLWIKGFNINFQKYGQVILTVLYIWWSVLL